MSYELLGAPYGSMDIPKLKYAFSGYLKQFAILLNSV